MTRKQSQSELQCRRNRKSRARVGVARAILRVHEKIAANLTGVSGGCESRRVLIIDDNVALAENIAEILRLEGHQTNVAASAEEALSKHFDHDVDVVVTDYRLPGISGAEFLRQHRRKWMNVQTVVISAYSDEDTVGEATDVGASFFPKPVDFKRLIDLIFAGPA